MRRHRPTLVVDRSLFGPRDLLAEASAGVLQRPGRSALTMLGTALGIGAFVAILGLTSTAAGQISQRFSVLQATEVTVRDLADPQLAGPSFPADAADRVRRLNGVVEAGEYWRVPLADRPVSARPAVVAGDGVSVPVEAMGPGALRAIGATMRAGVLFNEFHARRGERVAVLGATAAAQLGIGRVGQGQAVFIGSDAYTVVGIIGQTSRLPETMLSVLVPDTTALQRYGPPEAADPAKMLIETRLGAAALIARQAPVALRPDNPGLFSAVAPPDPHTLRDEVSTDVNGLFLVLAFVALVIGAIGIANTTLVAILERSAEIGLRRSLGARRRHVAAQFLTESTLLGALGGLVGTSAGVLVIVVVAFAKHWTTVIDPVTVYPAPVAGAAVGVLAGLYPALRAASIEPIDALRR